MPNHLHGILWIFDAKEIPEAVGAGFKPTLTRHGLSEIVRGLKTFSARKINSDYESKPKFCWQRGFYEHIIRDDMDLYQHRRYIRDNPMKWDLDEYF